MSISQEIRGALQTRFASAWGTAETIAYEGKPYEPQPNVPWAEVTILTGTERPVTMGDDHLVLHEGMMMAVLVYPGNKGTGLAEAKADEIKEAFRASDNARAASDTAAVRFRYAEKRPAVIDAVSTRVPIAIGWYTYDTRY